MILGGMLSSFEDVVKYHDGLIDFAPLESHETIFQKYVKSFDNISGLYSVFDWLLLTFAIGGMLPK